MEPAIKSLEEALKGYEGTGRQPISKIILIDDQGVPKIPVNAAERETLETLAQQLESKIPGLNRQVKRYGIAAAVCRGLWAMAQITKKSRQPPYPPNLQTVNPKQPVGDKRPVV